jgi:hypothetical protein
MGRGKLIKLFLVLDDGLTNPNRFPTNHHHGDDVISLAYPKRQGYINIFPTCLYPPK